ncbi:MAG TPA: hypothetical protein VF310_14285, partial [Vicinamibacteria bacterium]
MRASLALLAFLTACRPPAPPAPRAVVVAYPSGPADARAHVIAGETALAVFSNVYETLVQLGPQLELRPGLAETWYT